MFIMSIINIGESVMRKPEFRSWGFSRAESLETWVNSRHSPSGTEACAQGPGTPEVDWHQLQLDVKMIHLCAVCMFIRAQLSHRV